MLEPIGVDFETLPIVRRPDYPPAPVGLALDFPGMEPFYLSWGHPVSNNCTEAEAKEWGWKAWNAPNSKVFHNGKFDLAVFVERWGFPMLHFREFDDTMFLAFLADPHAFDLGLKSLATEWLNEPPSEKDALTEWVQAHKTELLQTYPWNRKLHKKTGEPVNNIAPSETGSWIFACPGDLVGRYAVGDVRRTRGLWNEIAPLIRKNGLWAAYERKKRLVPIFMENEREGLPVNLERLEIDIHRYSLAFDGAEDWLRRALNDGSLNFDADLDVANALIRNRVVDEQDFPRTKATKKYPRGQYSVSKEVLLPDLFQGERGKQIASVLGYRNRLKTCLTMFMQPWAKQARQTNGTIHTNWNLTRGLEGGTRSGRPSTFDHNLLNISKSFDKRDDGYVHPEGMPELPLVRKYIIAEKGEIILHRDISQQELRLFGHFEQGELNQKYNENPALDVHDFVGEKMAVLRNDDYWISEDSRTTRKTINFQSVYGGGVPALSKKAKLSTAQAREFKEAHNQALPGRVILNNVIKSIVMRGLPIVTVGGRWYFPEKPGLDGRSKIYKLINYLIQGSAADFTEECLLDWYYHPKREGKFLITVYDEINSRAPIGAAAEQMELLREVLEAPRITVPVLSDGKWGYSWGELEKCPANRAHPPKVLTAQQSRQLFLTLR